MEVSSKTLKPPRVNAASSTERGDNRERKRWPDQGLKNLSNTGPTVHGTNSCYQSIRFSQTEKYNMIACLWCYKRSSQLSHLCQKIAIITAAIQTQIIKKQKINGESWQWWSWQPWRPGKRQSPTHLTTLTDQVSQSFVVLWQEDVEE